MENPTTTPSTAQQAENNGSERTFTQDEVNNHRCRSACP